MKVERTVIDTNVLISAALLAGSVPAQLLNDVLRRGRLVFSDATFVELESRLWRPKFDRYVSIDDRKALLRDLQAAADWVDPVPVGEPICRDPADQKFITTAQAAHAEVLVSGDKDLLVLRKWGLPPAQTLVLTPAQALRRLAVVG